MQPTNNALAEETGCAKDGDDRCDHSVPDIVKLLLWTREDCDRSTDLKPSQLVTSCATPACQSRSSAPVAVCAAMLSQAPEACQPLDMEAFSLGFRHRHAEESRGPSG